MAIQLGSEIVGIASVEDINKYAPPGHRPGLAIDLMTI